MFTEGYRMHLLRMEHEHRHMLYVTAMRKLVLNPRIEPAITAGWIASDALVQARSRTASLISVCESLLCRLRRARTRVLQARVLSASVLEQSLGRLAAAAPRARSTARKPQSGWSLAQQAAKPQEAKPNV